MLITLLIAFAIGLNLFSRAISCGASTPKVDGGQIGKTAAILAGGHFLLFMAGGLAGSAMDGMIYSFKQNVCLALLLLVGLKMIYYTFKEIADDQVYDLNHVIVPVALALATGVDSFLSGMALAFVRIQPLQPALMTAIIVLAFAVIGINIGAKNGRKILKFKPCLFAGLLMIAIGVLNYFHLLGY